MRIWCILTFRGRDSCYDVTDLTESGSGGRWRSAARAAGAVLLGCVCVCVRSLSLSLSLFFSYKSLFLPNQSVSPPTAFHLPLNSDSISLVSPVSLTLFLLYLHFSLPNQSVPSSLSLFFSLIYPLLPQLFPLLLLPTLLLLLSRRGGQCMWPDWLDCLSRYIQQQLHIHRFRPCLVMSTLCWTQVLYTQYVL